MRGDTVERLCVSPQPVNAPLVHSCPKDGRNSSTHTSVAIWWGARFAPFVWSPQRPKTPPLSPISLLRVLMGW